MRDAWVPLLLVPALWAFMPETLQRHTAAGVPHERTPILRVLFGEGRATPTLLLWIAFLPTLLILYLILNWLPLLATATGGARHLSALIGTPLVPAGELEPLAAALEAMAATRPARRAYPLEGMRLEAKLQELDAFYRQRIEALPR